MSDSSSSSFSSLDSDSDIFEVQAILTHIVDRNKNVFFKIRWKGFDESEDTYEPIANLTGCWKLIESYCEGTNDLTCKGVGEIVVGPKDNKQNVVNKETQNTKKLKPDKNETKKESVTGKDKQKDNKYNKRNEIPEISIEPPPIVSNQADKKQAKDSKKERKNKSKKEKADDNKYNKRIEIPKFNIEAPPTVSKQSDKKQTENVKKERKNTSKKKKVDDDKYNKRIEIPIFNFETTQSDSTQLDKKQTENNNNDNSNYKEDPIINTETNISSQFDEQENNQIQKSTKKSKSKSDKQNYINIKKDKEDRKDKSLKASTKMFELLNSFPIQRIKEITTESDGQKFAVCQIPDQENDIEIPISYVQFLAPEELNMYLQKIIN